MGMPSIWSQDNYIRAFRFAAEAHRGQLVPGTDLPYVVHVGLVSMEVIAALAAESGHDGDLAVVCALLHDVLEDTPVETLTIKSTFGAAVAEGVLALSKDSQVDKELRLADSLERIRGLAHEVWMVKLADRITNLQPPPSHWTKEKIICYHGEALHILAQLGDASPVLARRLREKIVVYGQYLRHRD
jgi:(p)ppGpp synthase/HD superfamily hydrolase